MISTETNYQSQTVRTPKAAIAFAQSIGFPEHGVVVMRASQPQPKEPLVKGVTTETELVRAVTIAIKQSPHRKAHIETDMRALYNPTRMAVIAQATRNLIEKLGQRCPSCGYPGFAIVQHQPGLPCSLCKSPTLLPLTDLYRCQHCQFQQTQPFPDSVQFADPARCFYCNP